MNRLPILTLLALGNIAAFAADAPRPVAFERDGTIFTTNLDGKGTKKIAQGDLPEISPDGTRVAYNTDEDSAKSPVRYIAVADLASGKSNVFKKVPSDNAFGAVWSPDSQSLLFSIMDAGDWQLALVKADGTGFRIVKKAEAKDRSYYSPCWAADGKSFFCHDLEAVYHFDLDGKLLKKWALQEIVTHGDMSSSDRIAASPDGKTLLMEIEMDEQQDRKNWDGPPPSLWLLDFSSDKAERLTAKDYFAWDPAWINSEEFVFLSQGPKEDKASLYRGSTKAKEHKLILKNVHTPSVAR